MTSFTEGLWEAGFFTVLGLADIEPDDVQHLGLKPVTVRQLRKLGLEAKAFATTTTKINVLGCGDGNSQQDGSAKDKIPFQYVVPQPPKVSPPSNKTMVAEQKEAEAKARRSARQMERAGRPPRTGAEKEKAKASKSKAVS